MGNLFSSITALFKPRAAAAERQAVVKTIPAAPPPGEPDAEADASHADTWQGDYADLPGVVDAGFFAWMVGHSGEDADRDESFERKIIDYLDVLARSDTAGANLIPRVPSIMVQLLKRSHEENVTGSELSQLITKDVLLVTAILNEVNSSYYKTDKKVTELSQAIMLLGHNRLRMVLAKISFTPVFNDQLGKYTKLAAAKLWDESQQRALASYILARHYSIDPFRAFLAGLMQDVGVIVALRVFDRSGAESDLPTSTEFRLAFQHQALILSARIGQIWTLPENVTATIEGQLSGAMAASDPMVMVLNKANFISKTCQLINAGLLHVDMKQMKTILGDAEFDCLSSLLSGQVSVANIL